MVEGLEEACGVVDVKRVGSAGGERDIVIVGFGGQEEVGGIGLKIEIWRDWMERCCKWLMPEVFRCYDVIGWIGFVRTRNRFHKYSEVDFDVRIETMLLNLNSFLYV